MQTAIYRATSGSSALVVHIGRASGRDGCILPDTGRRTVRGVRCCDVVSRPALMSRALQQPQPHRNDRPSAVADSAGQPPPRTIAVMAQR